jgi:Holliday junction resolvase-like predicted endonuclease
VKEQEKDIIKTSGDKVKFSLSKLRRSLKKSGASDAIVSSVVDEIRNELYQGISTTELYNSAFKLLKEYNGPYASRYKLKKAIYELGPSGFRFEKFVSKLLSEHGYMVQLNIVLNGKCVSHEIDLIAVKGSERNLIECKFHSEEGRKCDVKVALYINSRFQDINALEKNNYHQAGWLVTNTKFTKDAITYGKCMRLQLLSWDYPANNSLKELIDSSGIYPVTASTLLSGLEKQYLLDKEIILARDLIEKPHILDYKAISPSRQKRILSELKILCKTK